MFCFLRGEDCLFFYKSFLSLEDFQTSTIADTTLMIMMIYYKYIYYFIYKYINECICIYYFCACKTDPNVPVHMRITNIMLIIYMYIYYFYICIISVCICCNGTIYVHMSITIYPSFLK